MPLIRYRARVAVRNRKANFNAGWGDRGTSNRVEPVAMPAFVAPFQLIPGEPIFTIGSCFARNVENELMRRGFRVPVRELFKRDEFRDLDPGTIINNYGTPSIANELAWAFGERAFDTEKNILEIAPGRYANLHISPSTKPLPRDVAVRQREAIQTLYTTVRQCRVVIMTLGLVEVWFDTETGLYLNAAPRKRFYELYPERFDLHVLSFKEAYAHLRDALDMLRRHGHPDLRVLLTVSPVPLSHTHRPDDVIVANSYSKAVLRVAAEQACAEFKFAAYYPSYESITLTDRKIAYYDDLVHVTDEMVDLQVSRMISAYTSDSQRSEEEAGDLSQLAQARHLRLSEDPAAGSFFAARNELAKRSEDFALEKALWLQDNGGAEEAIALLLPYAQDTGGPSLAVASALANAHLLCGKGAQALGWLDLVRGQSSRVGPVYHRLIETGIKLRNAALVADILARYREKMPKEAQSSFPVVAQFFAEQGLQGLAAELFVLALKRNPTFPLLANYAEFLVNSGRNADAAGVLENLTATSPAQQERIAAIRSRLPHRI